MRGLLARVARSAPVPVFAVAGAGARDAVRDLRLRSEIELVPTPRHAAVLVVAGSFPDGEVVGLAQVHDQIPIPRATVRWWGRGGDEVSPTIRVEGDEDALVVAVVEVHRRLLDDPSLSEPPILPDEDPVEWRGVGPYGQGGKGMTGGTPYGRPLAERADDRDGLTLDQLAVTVGPWVGALPPGLQMRVKLQGDLIQEVEVGTPVAVGAEETVFSRAVREPVPVAELELERARHHLRWLADALTVQGLTALGIRCLRLAKGLTPDRLGEVERLLTMVRRSGIFGLALNRAGGTLTGGVTEGLGPVARAAGLADDARLEDASYRALGFEAILHRSGDVAARWRQRMAEIVQSLQLCARAGDRLAFGSGIVEGPRGLLTAGGPQASARLVGILTDLLPGMEWGDAVAALWSLDPDPMVDTTAEVGLGGAA